MDQDSGVTSGTYLFFKLNVYSHRDRVHLHMVLQYVFPLCILAPGINERRQIVTTMIIAYLADKYKHRSGFIAFSVSTCIVGICLLAFAEQNSVRYFGMVSAASCFAKR
jgi:hypothetical protein